MSLSKLSPAERKKKLKVLNKDYFSDSEPEAKRVRYNITDYGEYCYKMRARPLGKQRRMLYCPLSNELLRKEEMVACELGRVYNRKAIINYLLRCVTVTQPELFQHIKSIKHVKDIQLTDSGVLLPKKQGLLSKQYVCPISGEVLSTVTKFVMLWRCALVFSEKAFKMSTAGLCPKCLEPALEKDLIVLIPDRKDQLDNEQKMTERRLSQEKAKKKVTFAPEVDKKTTEVKKETRDIQTQVEEQNLVYKITEVFKDMHTKIISDSISLREITKIQGMLLSLSSDLRNVLVEKMKSDDA